MRAADAAAQGEAEETGDPADPDAIAAPAEDAATRTSHEAATASPEVSAMRSGALSAKDVRVWFDDMRALCVATGEREFRNVRAVGVFPLTHMAEYVSFLDKDGKEVLMVADPARLDVASRRALERALGRMYYKARIIQVFKIAERMGVTTWEVMTDCGYATFEVLSREHIRELEEGHFIIADADGNRFEIPDFAQLDPESQVMILSET
jgi:hypothetical protein